MNQTRQTSAAFEANRQQLQALQRTSGNINSFRSLNQTLQQTRAQMDQARTHAQQLAQTHRAIANPTRAMTREFEQARQRVRDLQQTERDQVRQLQGLRTALQSAGVQTNRLADHQQSLDQRIRQTTEQMQRQRAEMDRHTARTRRLTQLTEQRRQTMERFDETIGYGGTMLGVGAAASASVVLPVIEFAKAEDAATQLKVSMMGVGGAVAPEFQKINDLANELGNKLPGTTAEFQTMMAKLVQQGMSYKAILGGVGQASAYLGVQLQMPFDAAAEFAAKMQDATKTTEGDMLGLMDVIQKSFYLGVDPTNMLGGFSAISDGMKTIKQSGLEGAKAMAPLLVMADQASMQGSTAGIAFSKIFSKMMDTKNIQKSLKGTGLKMNFTDGKGEFGGLDKMYDQLSKLKKLSTEDRKPIFKAMFGDDAETTKALNLLIDKGKAGYDDTINKMKAQADLQTRVNQQLGTLKNLWDSATGTFSNAMVAFGAAIAPEVKSLVALIANASEGLQNWAKANPVLASSLMKVVGFFGALFLVLGGLTIVLASVLLPFALLRFSLMSFGLRSVGIIGLIGRALGGLSMMIRAVGFALVANPLLAAFLLLAVAAYLIYNNWAPIKEFFINLWSSIVGAASAGIEAVVNFFSTGISRAQAFFSSGLGNISATILNWSPIGLFYSAFAAVLSWFGIELPSKFTGFGQMLMQGLANGITAGIGWVIEKARAAANAVKDTAKSALGIHSPSRVFHEIGGFTMQGMGNGLLANAHHPINAMNSTSQGLIKAMDTSQIRIDRRPPIGSKNNQGQTGTSAGMVVNMTIHAAPGMNEQQLAQLVAKHVQQAQRSQGCNAALYDHQ
jgi:TP901 family phage tail tape measure protein